MELEEARIIPVVVLKDASRANELGAALVEGRVPIAEVTFRTAAAADGIEIMAANRDLLVGAGTVISPEQVDRAHDAGARFIVSPGFSPAVVERCQELGLPVVPGAATPTEIMQVLAAGLTLVKFFPASVYGGLAAVKALSAPFPQVRFVPTGGVGEDNLAEWLANPAVQAVGGSWMVPASAVDAGDFDAVRERCARAADIAAHIGESEK